MELSNKQIAILRRLADQQDAAQSAGYDPADAEDCVYLAKRDAEPLCAQWLIAQLIVDDDLRPFYTITDFGREAIGREKLPVNTEARVVRHLSKRDKHNIRVLHNEFGIAQRVLARFFRVKPGSIGWLIHETNY